MVVLVARLGGWQVTLDFRHRLELKEFPSMKLLAEIPGDAAAVIFTNYLYQVQLLRDLEQLAAHKPQDKPTLLAFLHPFADPKARALLRARRRGHPPTRPHRRPRRRPL